MKKSLVLFTLALISTSTFAKDYTGGMSLRDGSRIIRIDIGKENDSDTRQLSKRVLQLERAVRELQNRVYDIEEDSRPSYREVKVVTCVLPTSFNGTFIGKASTEVEARALAVNNCKKGRGSFCNDNSITRCETSTEVVN